MTEHLQWVEHKGKRILVAKFSGLKDEKAYVQAIADLEREIIRQPRGTLIGLILDVSDTRVTKVVTDRGKQMMETARSKGVPDGPTALVGLEGAQKAIVLALQVVRSDLHVAKSMEDAKDWVVKQLK